MGYTQKALGKPRVRGAHFRHNGNNLTALPVAVTLALLGQNPPHRAHVLLGINAAKYLTNQGHSVHRCVSTLVFASVEWLGWVFGSVHYVPGSDNYQWNKIKAKAAGQTVITAADQLTYDLGTRIEMLQLLICQEPDQSFPLIASDFESTIPECFEDSPGYWARKLPTGYLKTISTATLIRAFASKHPSKRIAIVFGADNLCYMPTWSHLPQIFNVADLMVVTRGQCRFEVNPQPLLRQFDRLDLVGLPSSPQFVDHKGLPVLQLAPGRYQSDARGDTTLFVLPPIPCLETASSTELRRTLLRHIGGDCCEGEVDQLAMHGYRQNDESRTLLVEAGRKALENSEQMLAGIEQRGRANGQMITSLDDSVSLAIHQCNGKQLNLSNMGLHELPREAFRFTSTLELLNMGGNRLSCLPEDFHKFEKLRIAFFAGNRFEVFPPVLGRMPSLYMISFKSNRVTKVPSESLSPSVGWLILTDNQIECLPSTIGSLKKLRKCMLAANKLKQLPDEMAQCTQLELLRIAANKLQELPAWLFQLPKLAWLAASGNPCLEPVPETEISEIASTDLTIHQVLGEGASGTVSKATYHKAGVDRDVAVKIFKGAATSDGLPEEELKATMMLTKLPTNSQSAFTAVIGQTAGGPPGLILDLIPEQYEILGNPPSFVTCTRDTFSSDRNLTAEQAFAIAQSIAEAATQLHQLGLCHGDVYAHNILVSLEEAVTGVRLCDLGAATFYRGAGAVVEQSYEAIEARAFGCLVDDLLGLVKDETVETALLREVRDAVMSPNIRARPSFHQITNFLQDPTSELMPLNGLGQLERLTIALTIVATTLAVVKAFSR